MKEPVFTGACTAIVTPFRPNGAIDYATFSRLIEIQLTAGVDAICVCGTTGESSTLSLQEHISLVDHCVRQVDGQCKVIAGAGSNDTATAVYLSQHAQESGADGLLIVTPYYNKTTQTGLIRHYEFIAERTEIPLIFYNVPSRTGISATAETYAALSQHPRINGVKEASGDFTLLLNTLAICGDQLNIWSGNDDHAVPMMSLGAKGLISVLGNLVPREVTEMTHACLDGDHTKAANIQIKYAGLIRALFREVNPIPVKAALHELGLDSGYLRLPLWEISPGSREKLLEELQKAGVSGKTRKRRLEDGIQLTGDVFLFES